MDVTPVIHSFLVRINTSFILDSGRSIQLKSLEQRLIYEGLLDGGPTAELNAGLIECIVGPETANRHLPVLVPPVQRPSANGPSPGPMEGAKERVFLPDVEVTARFESHVGVAPGADFSTLTIVWFQDEWALPIDGDVLAWIRSVDWDAHAQDLVW